jgi:hypothetical protein
LTSIYLTTGHLQKDSSRNKANTESDKQVQLLNKQTNQEERGILYNDLCECIAYKNNMATTKPFSPKQLGVGYNRNNSKGQISVLQTAR